MFGLLLLFLIVSSFKPDLQIFADLTTIKAFLPVGDLTLDNYSGVFQRVPFATFMLNSVMISVITVGLGLVVNSMAAFALSRMKFKGQHVVLGVILATLIVPFETMALPLLWWSNKLPFFDFVNGYSQGWLDTYQIQIVPSMPTRSRSSSSTSTSTRSRSRWTRRPRSMARAGSGSTGA